MTDPVPQFCSNCNVRPVSPGAVRCDLCESYRSPPLALLTTADLDDQQILRERIQSLQDDLTRHQCWLTSTREQMQRLAAALRQCCDTLLGPYPLDANMARAIGLAAAQILKEVQP